MPYLERDGITFRYRDEGSGLPFVFQHGLGADVAQPFGLFQPPPGCRLLAMDFRAHGETRPLGDGEKLSIACFADDVIALLNALSIPRAIVGGVSLGAAVALNLVLRHADRVIALVLSRPAWLDGPNAHNVEIYSTIAALIRRYGGERGLELFRRSDLYLETEAISADAAASLAGQFTQPRASETVLKLERLPMDAPCRGLEALAAIEVRTLVLASRQDPIHPFEYGVHLARSIPRATFRELTPKAVSKERHVAEVQALLEEFVRPLAALENAVG
jgi:pimeloyl-ACP methyl ester carboxylesterase